MRYLGQNFDPNGLLYMETWTPPPSVWLSFPGQLKSPACQVTNLRHALLYALSQMCCYNYFHFICFYHAMKNLGSIS